MPELCVTKDAAPYTIVGVPAKRKCKTLDEKTHHSASGNQLVGLALQRFSKLAFDLKWRCGEGLVVWQKVASESAVLGRNLSKIKEDLWKSR